MTPEVVLTGPFRIVHFAELPPRPIDPASIKRVAGGSPVSPGLRRVGIDMLAGGAK